MNNIQNVNPFIPPVTSSQAGEAQKVQAGAAQPLPPLLGGFSVTVSAAPYTDLEKLVARLKNEHENTKSDVAQRRLASVLDIYSSRYGEITDKGKQALEDITANNAAIDEKTKELAAVEAALEKGEGDAKVLQTEIESLQRAIAQAIEDGKTHRENVAKLKEQLAHDQGNEQLKAELKKEEAAVKAADEARAKAEGDLTRVQAKAVALSLQIQTLTGQKTVLNGAIADLNDKNAKLAAFLDTQTVKNLLAAFKEDIPETDADAWDRPSHADRKKIEEKSNANNPANILHEAMERMDESILRDIDEKRDKKV